jgi:uncharacterized membrane protein
MPATPMTGPKHACLRESPSIDQDASSMPHTHIFRRQFMQSRHTQTLAFAMLAAAVATSHAPAHAGGNTEKCYGIAQAGKNDCSTRKHSCAGQAKTNNDPSDWKAVAKGTCQTMGGQLTAG